MTQSEKLIQRILDLAKRNHESVVTLVIVFGKDGEPVGWYVRHVEKVEGITE